VLYKLIVHCIVLHCAVADLLGAVLRGREPVQATANLLGESDWVVQGQEYKGKKRHEVPPHVYAIADQSYRNMLQGTSHHVLSITKQSTLDWNVLTKLTATFQDTYRYHTQSYFLKLRTYNQCSVFYFSV